MFNWQKVPESTYIATAPMPWVDGFVTWTKTEVSDNVRCCRYHKHNPDTFCPSNFGQPSAGQEADQHGKTQAVDDSMFEPYDQYYYDVTEKSRRQRRQADDYDYYGDYGDYGDYGSDTSDLGRSEDRYAEAACLPCNSSYSSAHRPTPTQFGQTIGWFLKANPGDVCPSAGHAAYGESVKLSEDPGTGLMRVGSSNMMAFHTILKTSKDYYMALARARELTDSVMEFVNNGTTDPDKQVNIFPYSVFYVFYEQYLTMWEDTLFSLGISLGSIFVVTFLMMGLDLTSATIVLFTVLLILVNLGAFMFWWNITLNAVSLTNLVMAVGISVEFCAHIMKYFAKFAQEDRVENAKKAVINMGSSVLSGITLTKFGGIIVLAFANSQIFTIFFFRWAF